MPRVPAAFFDLDNTLIQGDSQAMEASFFMKHRHITPLYVLRLLRVLAAGPLYRHHLLTPWHYNQIYLKTYSGRHITWLENVAQMIFTTTIKQALYPEMTDILATHRDNGYRIVVVSATARHLLSPIARELRPDAVIGTHLETTPSGICTGRPDGRICIGDEKLTAIRTYAKESGVDLATSYAYSDHHADIPFLGAVGIPVAVNPTPLLRQTARKRGWSILDI